MSKLIDLTGKTFGKLTVLKRCLSKTYVNGEILWECVCSCSKKTIIHAVGSTLRTGGKKSCGCIWKPSMQEYLDNIHSRLIKHSKLNGQCIEWTGFLDKNGYGKIWMKENGVERCIATHRASWLFHKGKIPSGMLICHHCDNPACFRIEHLFLGTHQDNMKDKISKNRGNYRCGEQFYLSKLKEYQVIEILRLKRKGITSNELSKKYGVSSSTIRGIWDRRSWKHVEV